FIPTLVKISKEKIEDTRSIWAWIIESSNKKIGTATASSQILKNINDAVMTVAELTCSLAHLSEKEHNQYHAGVKIIRAGSRDEVIRDLRMWVKDNVKDELKITDPYFGQKDIEFIHFVILDVGTILIIVVMR